MNYTKMFIKPSNSSNHIANWHTYISSHDSSEEPQPQHQHMYRDADNIHSVYKQGDKSNTDREMISH